MMVANTNKKYNAPTNSPTLATSRLLRSEHELTAFVYVLFLQGF